MKISRGDIVITEIPGIRSIVVTSGDDTRILIKPDGATIAQTWELDELTAFRDALSVAIDAATAFKQGTGETKPIPIPARCARVFGRGDDIPSDILQIKDADGYVWTRRPERWDSPEFESHDGMSIWYILDSLGPVTEVLP